MYRRKLITPSFHFDILKDYLLVINEQTELLIDNLKKVDKSKKIALMPYLRACALDIICGYILSFILLNLFDEIDIIYIFKYRNCYGSEC